MGFVSGQSNKIVKTFEDLEKFYIDNAQFLGMLAFVYVHHDKDRAPAVINKALIIEPNNAWLQHVYTHIEECKENYDPYSLIEALATMTSDWPKQSRFFESHNWMHLCLLKIKTKTPLEELLKDYHNHIWGDAKDQLFEQNNAFIFLWMAELNHYDLHQELWDDLAHYAKKQVDNYFSPYFSITTLLSLAKAKDKHLHAYIKRYEKFSQMFASGSHEYKVWYLIGHPMLEGMLAYINQNDNLAYSKISSVIAENYLLGHSDEQRSIFSATLQYLSLKAK